MNNYSAEASTEEIIELLRGILEKADERLNKLEIEHHDMFKEAKEYAYNEIQDDERLIELMENYGQIFAINSFFSNYSAWERMSWVGKIFVKEPPDDREQYRKNEIRTIAQDARTLITNILNGMEDLTNFYNTARRFALKQAGSTYSCAVVEELLLVDMVKSKLPENLSQRNDELRAFSRNVKRIKEMHQRFTVHEFQTVTIEEDMLAVIDSVQNEIS